MSNIITRIITALISLITIIAPATEKVDSEALRSFATDCGFRTEVGVVTDVYDGLAYIETAHGEIYSVYMEDYCPGYVVSMLMHDNGTPIIYDDVIIWAHVVSDFNDMLSIFSHVNYQRDVEAEWVKVNNGLLPKEIKDIER